LRGEVEQEGKTRTVFSAADKTLPPMLAYTEKKNLNYVLLKENVKGKLSLKANHAAYLSDLRSP